MCFYHFWTILICLVGTYDCLNKDMLINIVAIDWIELHRKRSKLGEKSSAYTNKVWKLIYFFVFFSEEHILCTLYTTLRYRLAIIVIPCYQNTNTYKKKCELTALDSKGCYCDMNWTCISGSLKARLDLNQHLRRSDLRRLAFRHREGKKTFKR